MSGDSANSGLPLDLDGVLRAAREAQRSWGRLSVPERLRPVAALQARLVREGRELAEIVAAETGKSRYEASAPKFCQWPKRASFC